MSSECGVHYYLFRNASLFDCTLPEPSQKFLCTPNEPAIKRLLGVFPPRSRLCVFRPSRHRGWWRCVRAKPFIQRRGTRKGEDRRKWKGEIDGNELRPGGGDGKQMGERWNCRALNTALNFPWTLSSTFRSFYSTRVVFFFFPRAGHPTIMIHHWSVTEGLSPLKATFVCVCVCDFRQLCGCCQTRSGPSMPQNFAGSHSSLLLIVKGRIQSLYSLSLDLKVHAAAINTAFHPLEKGKRWKNHYLKAMQV